MDSRRNWFRVFSGKTNWPSFRHKVTHRRRSFPEIWQNCLVDRGPGNHAVGADDARVEESDIFDIKLDMFNSWGLTFGDQGRSFIGVDHLEEPMKYHAMYAIRFATLDLTADNPFV